MKLVFRSAAVTVAALTSLWLTPYSQAVTNRPSGYVTICSSDETCTVNQPTNVAFGASGQFVYQQLNGSFVCNVATFGSDPIPSKTVKECSIPADASGGGSSGGGDSGGSGSSSSAITLSGSAGSNSVTLNWTAGSGSANYQIYYDTDSSPSGRVRIGVVNNSTHSYTAGNLQNGTTYWFWIKTSDANGNEVNSNAFSATPQGATPVEGATVVNSASGLISAVASASAGDTIYLRGGTYHFSEPIVLSHNGSSSAQITLSKYPSDSARPVLDFSAMSESGSNRGIELSGDYWYIYGIDVQYAGDNGMHITGSHNTVEFSTFSHCADTGLQLDGGASYNLIRNVDSFFNADASLENADGFAAKLTVGTGNRFYGCRAWNNLDDGYDGYLRGSDNITTTYENCWAIRNGYLESGSPSGGDGNGFKTGGSDNKQLRHNATYINSIAAGNAVDGFDHNSNRGNITIYNGIAYRNGRNIGFGSSNQANSLTIKNTISYSYVESSDSFHASTTDISHNSWQNGHSVSSSDFISTNIDELLGARKADGSLPDVNFFHLRSNSDLIDAGTNVGQSYHGSAPDIGAFETN
ncbi:right-handed parallel beta-helix repeat-containing protein [Celerinatantimonas sp. YJH-8]|uniref:right-handed parallel beta-helix repeat-containing protein n=1 Tax=Celerinatantimonas sp. YJH-8 TaxID=3228714 RepID=UPI0038CA9463